MPTGHVDSIIIVSPFFSLEAMEFAASRTCDVSEGVPYDCWNSNMSEALISDKVQSFSLET